MLFLAQLGETFQQVGGQVSNLLTQYIPAEHVELIKMNLPETLVMPSPVMMLVYSVAVICALAVLEQVKYQLGRRGQGRVLPGASVDLLAECKLGPSSTAAVAAESAVGSKQSTLLHMGAFVISTAGPHTCHNRHQTCLRCQNNSLARFIR